MKTIVLAIALLVVHFVNGQNRNIQDIENPKDRGGYVSNPDNLIDRSTVDQINTELSELEQQDGFQVAVVYLNTIGRQVPKDFSTELAQYWGIGEKSKDNGLLILVVFDQKRIEFETGYGTETILTDVLAQRIQQEEMLPYFRENRFDDGILAGVIAVRKVLEGQDLEENTLFENEANENAAEYERRQKIRERNFWIGFAAWHLIGVAIYLLGLLFVRYQNDPYKKYNIIKNFSFWIWAVLFPVTHIFLVLLSIRLKERYRNQIRFSGKTNRIMHKLEENEEDKFLTLGQQAEEIVKSVDYDVWITDDHGDICILPYKPAFSKYTPCPKCRYKTYYKEYDRTKTAPTYSVAGVGEKKYSCANCKHINHTTYSIPRLQKRSRTSSGWIIAAGLSGSRGGSWGGGGSFGGGSFGGGSFGGGGSGSSW